MKMCESFLHVEHLMATVRKQKEQEEEEELGLLKQLTGRDYST